MDFPLKAAIELTAAQARVRAMTAEEMLDLIRGLNARLGDVRSQAEPNEEAEPLDPRKAVREKSIICMESGQPFRVLTRRHLAKYGLTPEQYRAKWGYPADMPLICKALQRERRKKMREIKLWEKRGK
ncbi:MucR family transcriptional regulator [Desulfovibrio aminophilus]|uniref:MucR family transcriptional regulator n=1 Tax=Desulfovibrio aminophilus TaxID=81425 RepID=UPI003393494E